MISLFRGPRDPWPTTSPATPDDLVAAPHDDDGRPKDAYPLWSPALYPPGARRGRGGVEAITALVVDVDDGTPIATTLDALRPLGCRVVVHTSYSHDPAPGGKAKYRAVIPLAAPYAPEFHARVWAWLHGLVPHADPACKDTARAYFVPVRRPGYTVEVVDGPLLEGPAPGTTWADLPEPPRGLPLRPPAAWVPTTDRPTWAPRPSDYPAATIAAARDALDAVLRTACAGVEGLREGRRTALRNAAYAVARYGWVSADAPARIHEAFVDAARRAGRLDSNVLTLLESCVNDAQRDPAPIEELVPAAARVASPVLVKHATSGAHWVLRADGDGYRGPCDARTALRYLADRGDVRITTDTGSPWSADRVFLAYGTAARAVELTYPGPWAGWDPTAEVLRYTTARRTPVEARFHPRVDRWLRALLAVDRPAGAVAGAHGVLDWLATANAPDLLGCPTAALYLEGPPGVGKGLLAQALAAPWGVGATPLDVALGTYPQPIATCAIVHLDEGISLDAAGTARFRTLVAERRHVLNEKYLPALPFVGCPRVLITANNPDALAIRSIGSLADLDAIVERILHFRVDDAAGRAARAVLADGGTAGWVTRADGSPGDVPEHLAWLAATREVIPGARWVVAGHRTPWHDGLLWHVPLYAAVLGGVVSGLTRRPAPVFVRDADGHVPVAAATLHARWPELVLEDGRRPTRHRVGEVLASLAADGGGGTWRVDGRIVEAYAATLGEVLPPAAAGATKADGT